MRIEEIDLQKIIYSSLHMKEDSQSVYITYNHPELGKKPLLIHLPPLKLLADISTSPDKYCTHEMFLVLTDTIKEFFNKLDEKVVRDCGVHKWIRSNSVQYKMTVRSTEGDGDDNNSADDNNSNDDNNKNDSSSKIIVKLKLLRTSRFKTKVFDASKNTVPIHKYQTCLKEGSVVKGLVEVSSVLIKKDTCCLHVRLLQLQTQSQIVRREDVRKEDIKKEIKDPEKKKEDDNDNEYGYELSISSDDIKD